MWDLWVKLYLGENEDSGQRGSISDTSEKLLQKGMGRDEVSKHVIFIRRAGGGTWNTFLHKFLL